MKGAGLLVHGGGPTQVMNASLAGVVEESRGCPDIQAIYGARHGIDGVLAADVFDLGGFSISSPLLSLAIVRLTTK